VTTDPGNGRTGSQAVAIPRPSCIRPRRVVGPAGPVGTAGPGELGGVGGSEGQGGAPQISLAGSGSARTSVRSAIYAALCGVRLASRDRQFLARLVNWDKRNAASVASLLWRARQAGREEAALTPRQLEVVLSALRDAAVYRASGRAAAFCWDCDLVPGGRCGEHAKDNDRARAYAEAARVLSAMAVPPPGSALPGAAPGSSAEDELSQPRGIAGYRRRAPVAS
jgi:hypothetical protein